MLCRMGPTDSTQWPGGVDGAIDQTARKTAFLAANPQWRVWKDRERDVWYGERMVPGGWETHARYTLGWLLNALGAP